ncbi:MAG: carbohydrate ABC transporter permease [Reyranellaceae bacterium]
MTARRLNRTINGIGVFLLSAVLLLWTLLPIYNIIRVSMQEKEEVLSTSVYPIAPSWHAFGVVFRQAFWLLETFWNQMGNSFYIGIVVALLTLTIGSLTSFTISRMRIRSGWMLTNAALLTYVIPASFLAIPFYGIMGRYGLTNHPLAVIAVEVTFATPYAIFIFQQYSASIPFELDEAARIDGASPPQVFFRIYLPLMMPALVAIGTYALLLSWNEYLYAFLLLSGGKVVTVPVTLGKFLVGDEAPWNYLMAAAIIYAIPPLIIYYGFRRRMSGGLTMGGVKG